MSNSKFTYEIGLSIGAPLFVSDKKGKYITTPEDTAPDYPEIKDIESLKDVENVISNMSKIDWSFTYETTGFLTHDLHPYPAKYIPHIPGNAISQLSQRGELIFDPFGGSGTTALEAVRLGRRAISLDANPIGTLIGKTKTCTLNKSASTDLHAIRCSLASRVNDLPKDPIILCNDYKTYIPEIPNIDKWFPLTSRGELALIKSRIELLESKTAKDIAYLALSRIILKASFQDSETRYTSKPRFIQIGETIKRFLVALDDIIQNVTQTQPVLRYGVCDFITADVRKINLEHIRDESIDLIATSPPYGNANDYHLYHRFRLLWLGYNPVNLAKMEIGSHLRHQKESTGFDNYLEELSDGIRVMLRVLKPGRYAVLVIGDAVYKNVLYKGAESVGKEAENCGFENICIIERQIHKTKRSFAPVGRRAATEKILILRKPPRNLNVTLNPPPYKLWPYEEILRQREIKQILRLKNNTNIGKKCCVSVDPYKAVKTKKLVFTHLVEYSKSTKEQTWQAIIENGFVHQNSARKDPKYVTHGLHSYKGKFYPQLAKGLINLSGISSGAHILDPFCGSGTTLLESYLNGHEGFGIDMNPLAAKIAKAKVGILEVNPDVFRGTIGTLLKKIEQAPQDFIKGRSEFNDTCVEEIERWFPFPVVNKINWLLKTIRGVSDGISRDFLEVILSDILRGVSNQDQKDLRIRRRKVLLEDADVLTLFVNALEIQYERIEKFWSAKGHSPNRFFPAWAMEGDSRCWDDFKGMGIIENEIDLVLTSPPYATALPYIDTDRLSLLTILGLDSSGRRPLEQNLVGSREIMTGEKRRLEKSLTDKKTCLPDNVVNYLLEIHRRISTANVGFRRKNMPSLLFRFFHDIDLVLKNCFQALKHNGQAMIVIGDNRMKIDDEYEIIPTTDFVDYIAQGCGFKTIERIDISVTTENLLHNKNAITRNVVLWLKKS